MEINILDTSLDDEQKKLLTSLLKSLTPAQAQWLSGYLAGLGGGIEAQHGGQASAEHPGYKPQQTDLGELKILYGTKSGNSKKVAEEAVAHALNVGIPAEAINVADYNVKNLKKESFVMVVISTDGEGEPPIMAEDFYNYLHGKKAPDLKGLKYSVLALGDSSYKHYCKIGRDVDAQFESLGGERIYERVDCDLDFEESAQKWYTEAIHVFKDLFGNESQKDTDVSAPEAKPGLVKYSKKHPYSSEILNRVNLNGRGSDKETLHLELDIENSGLVYEPGDSLGVISSNDPDLVEKILKQTKIPGDTKVLIDEEEKTLREALTHDFELTVLTPVVLENYSRYLLNDSLTKVLVDRDHLEEFMYGRDFLDILIEYPTILSAWELTGILRKMQPRLYSIASSYNANPDEVHLTVGKVQYEFNQRTHKGLCSTYLINRVGDDIPLKIYIDHNEGFRLPNDVDAPMIMVGPGTGVAPFRAFLQEREVQESGGKNWLFFGDRHFQTDFLYQAEFLKFRKNSVLHNIDVAFSRDQQQKIYVQDKMIEKGRELFKWLEEGAYFYLCGDQKKMAHDVRKALLGIIQKEGGMSPDKAAEYFKKLQKERRYQEDVY